MYALYTYKTRTRFVVIKRARDMKIKKYIYTQSRAQFHYQKRDLERSAAFGAFGARFEEALEQIKWKGGDFYRHWS